MGALVPCSFFDESFKTLSNHTLAARRAQCSDRALVRCGHFAWQFAGSFVEDYPPATIKVEAYGDNGSAPEFIEDQIDEQTEVRCSSQECLEAALKVYTSNSLIEEALQLETDGMMVWGEATKAAVIEEEEMPTAIKSNHRVAAAQQARSHSRSDLTRFYQA